MDPQALKDAVYGGANAALPAQVSGTTDPAVASSFSARYAAPVAHAVSNAAVNQSQMQVEEAKKAAAAAKQAQQDMLDPRKYQQIAKSDGGYGFFDPTGKEISAHDYARVVGASVDKVLADSENPIDKQYINDYRNFNEYMTAWQNGDTKKVEAIQSQTPELKNIKSPQELAHRFMQAYPTVYGIGGFKGPGTAGQPNNTNFIPYAGQQNSAGDYGISTPGGIGVQ
ncbi:hypothetical protein UFOVP1522_16 [uncultured Caudovirales phage]|uniref:Uncharacterized protein n=1 Tax=uncultured Caudovirales phage TaxID=2100421 RepID=A0A6J5S9M4_9CAUD|nr:hypothetical protein UFOVP989_7 [uncultured Caudovirales phage]CAB4181688.1 hypothetical protein UFOVP1075_59 [uncultured Caudovirales phage]CAB4198760.1 hypothetical protein UFOVP1312_51 [uncultured Caudovirales phage]CAB4210392.1 hypothetical protein UFOVP1426_7 [uncultured Caudovirales phage]CAB5227229.1 hypothetical protein UFOVP1522_16 [uncultured Caudovirales phage]